MFLAYGSITIKANEEKEYEDCKDLRNLIQKGYVELVDNSVPEKLPSKRGRKKKIAE